MSTQWYVVKEQQKKGPFTREELAEMARSGDIDPETLVWTEGMTDWTKGEIVEDLFSKSVPPPPPPIAHSGSQTSVSGTAPAVPTGFRAPAMQTGTAKKQPSTPKKVGKILLIILGVIVVCFIALVVIGLLTDSDTLKSTSVDGARVQLGYEIDDDLHIVSPVVTFEVNEHFYVSFNNNAPFDTSNFTLLVENSETNEIYGEIVYDVEPSWTIAVTELFFVPEAGAYKFSCIVDGVVRASQEVTVSDTLVNASVDGARIQLGHEIDDDLHIISPVVTFAVNENFYLSFDNNDSFETDFITLLVENSETNEIITEVDYNIEPEWTIAVTELLFMSEAGIYKFSILVDGVVRATQKITVE